MFRETEDDLQSLRRQFERETESFEFTKASLRRQKESLEGEITALQQEVSGLKASVAQLTSAQAGLTAELDATKVQCLNLETVVMVVSQLWNSKIGSIAAKIFGIFHGCEMRIETAIQGSLFGILA